MRKRSSKRRSVSVMIRLRKTVSVIILIIRSPVIIRSGIVSARIVLVVVTEPEMQSRTAPVKVISIVMPMMAVTTHMSVAAPPKMVAVVAPTRMFDMVAVTSMVMRRPSKGLARGAEAE